MGPPFLDLCHSIEEAASKRSEKTKPLPCPNFPKLPPKRRHKSSNNVIPQDTRNLISSKNQGVYVNSWLENVLTSNVQNLQCRFYTATVSVDIQNSFIVFPVSELLTLKANSFAITSEKSKDTSKLCSSTVPGVSNICFNSSFPSSTNPLEVSGENKMKR